MVFHADRRIYISQNSVNEYINIARFINIARHIINRKPKLAKFMFKIDVMFKTEKK